MQFENSRPSAAKAGIENEAFIAAVNRCATQKQEQNRGFQLYGIAEAVPFQNRFKLHHYPE
ncbi:MAG: hypothetical protein WBQ43_16280 [Terriglobales bacterium]